MYNYIKKINKAAEEGDTSLRPRYRTPQKKNDISATFPAGIA